MTRGVIDEAVTRYRHLTATNPAAFTPNLITSTRIAANLTSDLAGAQSQWAGSGDAVDARWARGQVRAAHAAWLPAHDHGDLAVEVIRMAADDADPDDPASPTFALARARMEVRSVALRRVLPGYRSARLLGGRPCRTRCTTCCAGRLAHGPGPSTERH